MAAPLLALNDIHLSFGGTPLLQGASLSIGEQERLCLVGRNGSGKSTLLKIAAGFIEPDAGERLQKPTVTVRYLAQEPDLSSFKTVLDYARSGLGPADDDYLPSYYLSALGLSGDEDPNILSGGQVRRAALAQVLAPQPDVLFLDEPTNHLDLPAIEWLEGELKTLRSALVMISHDRRFLSNLSSSTLWLDRGRSRHNSQGFSKFEEWRDKVLEEEEAEAHKLGRKIVQEEHWLRYGVTARRKRNVRRLGQLHDLRDKRISVMGEQARVKARVETTVNEAKASGKRVIEADNISKSFDQNQIIKDFSIKIRRGDRVGIIGPNGAGKTTLINLLTGAMQPDAGQIILGMNLEMQTLDQRRASLDPAIPLKTALTEGGSDMIDLPGGAKHVMGYMKDFLFQPEQAGTPVGELSGGERARVVLARALAKPSNMLVLDEPTNDLDLETLDLLQEMLIDYKGTLLLVSHDRDFLDRIVTSVLNFEGSGLWREYAGGYEDMKAQQKSSAKEAAAEKVATGKKLKASEQAKDKSRRKLSYKDQYALETLPKEIASLDDEIVKLQKAMEDPELFSRDPERFNKLATELAEKENKKNQLEDRWLELEMLREELETEV